MKNPDYAPLHPSMTTAFEIALRDHREILTELLLGADALQEATFQEIRLTGAQRCELNFQHWEIALGQGTKAAEVAAAMAGYKKLKNGRWISGGAGKPVHLALHQDLLKQHMYDLAETI